MNIKYNYNYIKGSMALSAVTYVAALCYYFFVNAYIAVPNYAVRIAQALFCTSGALSIIMLWIVNFRRKLIEKDLKPKKRNYIFGIGVVRFASNRYAVAVDILLLLLILYLMIISAYVLGVKYVWYKNVIKITIIWLIYIHGILNGRNYMFFKKLYKMELIADNR